MAMCPRDGFMHVSCWDPSKRLNNPTRQLRHGRHCRTSTATVSSRFNRNRTSGSHSPWPEGASQMSFDTSEPQGLPDHRHHPHHYHNDRHTGEHSRPTPRPQWQDGRLPQQMHQLESFLLKPPDLVDCLDSTTPPHVPLNRPGPGPGLESVPIPIPIRTPILSHTVVEPRRSLQGSAQGIGFPTDLLPHHTAQSLSMWDQGESQVQVPAVPVQDAKATSAMDSADHEQLLSGLGLGSVPIQTTDGEIEDDMLLDDPCLDLLVTTLARETARLEAATNKATMATSASAKQHHQNHHAVSVGTADSTDLKQKGDFDQADNQRSSELNHNHNHEEEEDDSGYSSEESSNPSTSGSGTSAPLSSGSGTGKGKSKAKKRVRRACIIPNCGKRSRSLGFCIAHGGGRRCIVAGCDKSSQGGNLCIKHGGGKRCSVDGCEKAAQTNSLCKAHGGGPRCQFEDCEKSSQGGGYCRQHGGGKRCAFAGCMKGTQRGSYCAIHGGSRLCIIDGCKRNDRGGGYCAHHGGGKRCTIANCTRPTRRNALCSTHLRLLGHSISGDGDGDDNEPMDDGDTQQRDDSSSHTG